MTTGTQRSKILLEFSLGRLAEGDVICALGIAGTEDLFLLMAQAHLPMPRLPDAVTRNMANSLHELPP